MKRLGFPILIGATTIPNPVIGVALLAAFPISSTSTSCEPSFDPEPPRSPQEQQTFAPAFQSASAGSFPTLLHELQRFHPSLKIGRRHDTLLSLEKTRNRLALIWC